MLDYRMTTFLSLCETMHYRRTAQALNMTQPAVTQHIHYLERAYGCRLFVYNGRKLQKTEQAAALETYARSAAYNQARVKAQLSGTQPHPLCIGATKTIGAFALPPLAQAYIAGGGTLEVLVDNTDRLMHLLDEGTLDFALIEGAFDKGRYGHTLLAREPFVGVCAQSHPLAGRAVSLQEALAQPLFVREPGSGTRAMLESLLTTHGHRLEHFARVHCVSDWVLTKSLVSLSLGVTFAYQALLVPGDGLCAFTLAGEPLAGEFSYVYLKDTDAPARIRAFTNA